MSAGSTFAGRGLHLKTPLVRTGVMLLGVLIVALVATIPWWALPWMTVLAGVLPYAILSFAFVSRGMSLSLEMNILRALVYVSAPTLVLYAVFIRAVADLLPLYAISGPVVFGGGSVLGAILLTFWINNGEGSSLNHDAMSQEPPPG